MSALADEILGQIADANEAGMIAHRIMSHFGLAGTVFVPEDVDERLSDYALTDDERDEFVKEYMGSRDWKYINDRTTEVGNWLIGEDVADRMRVLGV